MREAMAGGSELPVVRAAGIFAAAACWARSGAPLDVAAITLVWAMVSSCTECRPCYTLPRWMPSVLCEHVFGLAAALAVFIREMPVDDACSEPRRQARSCAILVGEVIGSCFLRPASPAGKWTDETRARTETDATAAPAQAEKSDEPIDMKRPAPPPSQPAGTLSAAEELAALRFEAAYVPSVIFTHSVLFLFAGLYVGDAGSRDRMAFQALLFVTCLLLRTWLHTMRDQQRARLLAGRCCVVLSAIRFVGQLAMKHILANARMNATSFIMDQAARNFLIQGYLGHSALHLSHRLAWTCITVASALAAPPAVSEIGWPLEPIITCSSILLGLLLSIGVESYRPDFPQDGVAALQQKPPAPLPPASPVASGEELATPDEETFVAQQFTHAFVPSMCLLGAIASICFGLAVGDTADQGHITTSIPLLLSCILFRTWLHHMRDQQRARLLAGHISVTLSILRQIATAFPVVSGPLVPAAAFSVTRLLILFLHAYMGYSAIHSYHRLAMAFIAVVGSIVHPQASEVGRPLEPIVTCAAILLGATVGWTVEDAARRNFKDLFRAQGDVQAARERARTIETESAAFKLATAAANRHADSQLNHLIKGSCGNARTFAHLILTHQDSSEQVIAWARCIDQELGTSIQWAHRRQVLVALNGGTYMSRKNSCNLLNFLQQKLTGDGTVQVYTRVFILGYIGARIDWRKSTLQRYRLLHSRAFSRSSLL